MAGKLTGKQVSQKNSIRFINSCIMHLNHLHATRSRFGRTLFMLIVIMMLSPGLIKAQSLSPSVIPTCGSYSGMGQVSLSWSLGEVMIPTVNSGGITLTQGFQQPEIQVWTSTQPVSVCAGSAIWVRFRSTGIMDNSNVFNAWLSDSTGNFSNALLIGSLQGNMTEDSIYSTIPASVTAGNGYRIRVSSSAPAFAGSDNGQNIQVTHNCFLNIAIRCYLQGFYAGAGTMTPVLVNAGIGMNPLWCDSIRVELRSPIFPFQLLASTTALLATNGMATCNLPVGEGSYYIVVKHRNTIETWSSAPGALQQNTLYDFTTSAGKAYNSNQVEVEPGIWAFYSGDINQDENIDLLDLGLLESDISQFLFGYYPTDINGDGNIDLLDSPIVEANINSFVFSAHP